mgnify:CR=1 FL=1
MTKNPSSTKVIIDKKLVKHLAWLSRIKLQEEVIEQYIPQLQDILEFFNQLDSVDTKSVPPTFHAIKLENVFREDEPHESMTVEDVLRNSKSRKEQYFRTKGMGAQE